MDYDAWRDHKETGSMSASKRRRLLAMWVEIAWKMCAAKSEFIRKIFEGTVLVDKEGEHHLRMERLEGITYNPFAMG